MKQNTPINLYSYSQLNTFRECPRKHYFSYTRNWSTHNPAPALVFGGAWGKAMDSIWVDIANDQHIETDILVERAIRAFLIHWTDAGLPWPLSLDEQAALTPRTPMIAKEMLTNYVAARRSFFSQISLISVEEPFVVPIHPTDHSTFYVGITDKIYKNLMDNRIYALDHKTTTLYAKAGFFRKQFLESFSPNSQMDGYQYNLLHRYGRKAGHLMIDAALVHKTVHHGFELVPVYHAPDILDSWLYEASRTVFDIEYEADHYSNVQDRERRATLYAYPRNTSSCHHFNGCQYLNICKTSPNPAALTTPPEFSEDRTSTAERLGLTPETLEDVIKGAQLPPADVPS